MGLRTPAARLLCWIIFAALAIVVLQGYSFSSKIPSTRQRVNDDDGRTPNTVEVLELEIRALKEKKGVSLSAPVVRDKDDQRALLSEVADLKHRMSEESIKLEKLQEELVVCRTKADQKDLKVESGEEKNADTPGKGGRPAPKAPGQLSKPTPPTVQHAIFKPVESHLPPAKGIDLVKSGSHPKGTIPVLLFAYKREKMLSKAVKHILDHIPEKGFHIYVSQDGADYPKVTRLAEKLASDHPDLISHLVHQRDTSGGNEHEIEMHWESYFAISHHYYYALSEVFKDTQYERIIILEEDIKVAPDFFRYMQTLSPLFDLDDELYCVSAWNDNGKSTLVADDSMLYRSDFFPGLGWMISRAIWKELKPQWPKGFWDDWMRQPDKRRGRSCIRPEVSRTYTWCSDEGVSQGQFCDQMAEMKLSKGAVDWEGMKEELLPGLVKPSYDRWLDKVLKNAQEVQSAQLVATVSGAKELKIFYKTNDDFQRLAQFFHLMDDFKDKVPRTAYRGVVSFRYRRHRVHLVARSELYD